MTIGTEWYVVTFEVGTIAYPSQLDGLRRVSLKDARSILVTAALIPLHGRIVNTETLEVTS